MIYIYVYYRGRERERDGARDASGPREAQRRSHSPTGVRSRPARRGCVRSGPGPCELDVARSRAAVDAPGEEGAWGGPSFEKRDSDGFWGRTGSIPLERDRPIHYTII